MVHCDTRAIGATLALLLLGGCQGSADVSGSLAGPAAGPAVGRIIEAESTDAPFGDYLAGRIAQAENDILEAARFYARALDGDPENPDLLRRTLAAFLIAGRIDEAIEYAERLEMVDEDPDGAALTLAVADVAQEDFTAAQERLADLPRVGFNTLLVPLLEAWAKFGDGDYEGAQESLMVLSENAAFLPIHDYHLALMSDLAGFDMAAESNYQSAIDSLDGSSIRVVQAAGSFFERTGDGAAARALYGRYGESHPDSTLIEAANKRLDSGAEPERTVADAREGFAEALYGIASALYQENAYEAALTYVHLATFLEPDLDVGHLLIGDIHASSNRNENAVESYSRVLSESPMHWPAQIRVADSFERLDEVERAVAQLRSMAAERPDRTDALVALGEILRAHERYAEAISAYDQAFERIDELQPRHWSMLYARGMSYERVGKWNEAEEDFLRALELVPEQPLVLNYLGYSWVEQGINLDKARKMIESAVAQRPTDGYIVDSLGWVLYRLGDYEGAVKHLERATELRPHDPVIIDHFGDALWKAGRKNEARFQWERALSFDPESDLEARLQEKIRSGVIEQPRDQAAQSETGGTEL